MKIEKSSHKDDALKMIRVTIGSESETMTIGEFSRIISLPLPMSAADTNVVSLARPHAD